MFPSYIEEMLKEIFSPDQMKVLEKEWDTYTDIRYSTATKRELKKTGQMVLDCIARPRGEL